MSLKMTVRTINSVVVLEMSGRLVLGEPAESLRDTIGRLLAEGYRAFLLDLSGVSHIDSSGLGQTIAAYASIRNRSGRVALLTPSTRASQILQIAKLATVFDMYDDEAEAIDAVKPTTAPIAIRATASGSAAAEPGPDGLSR